MMRFHASRHTPLDTPNIAPLSPSPRNGAWEGTKHAISRCTTANCCPPATRARTPDVELDQEMIKVLQNNWINYANLTRSQTRGYVTDEQQITLELADLLKDQSDQED